MEEPRPPYTTVASIVKNLEKKGYVQAKRYGNTYVYSPSIDEGEYQNEISFRRRTELFREFI